MIFLDIKFYVTDNKNPSDCCPLILAYDLDTGENKYQIIDSFATEYEALKKDLQTGGFNWLSVDNVDIVLDYAQFHQGCLYTRWEGTNIVGYDTSGIPEFQVTKQWSFE